MFFFDPSNLEVIDGLKNPADFIEYQQACQDKGAEAAPLYVFTGLIGKYLVSKALFPDENVQCAIRMLDEQTSEEQEKVMFPHGKPSRGLGDSIAKFTHATGLDKVAEAYTAVTGKPCGCKARQEILNRLVPYE